MLWGEGPWVISAERKKTNDGAKSEEKEENQNAVTACHAAEKILMKQRPLNVAEAENEIFTAGIAASGGVDKTIAGGEAVKTEEKKQISLTSLL